MSEYKGGGVLRNTARMARVAVPLLAAYTALSPAASTLDLPVPKPVVREAGAGGIGETRIRLKAGNYEAPISEDSFRKILAIYAATNGIGHMTVYERDVNFKSGVFEANTKEFIPILRKMDETGAPDRAGRGDMLVADSEVDALFMLLSDRMRRYSRTKPPGTVITGSELRELFNDFLEDEKLHL